MSKLILGLSGEIACGKGTVVKYLQDKYKAQTYRFSDPLREVVKRLHLEENRNNLQDLSTALRKFFGDDILSRVLLEDAKRSDTSIVILDGVRRFSDISCFVSEPCFRLVYIEAGVENRYNRIISRLENKDEFQKTFEEFVKDHEKETELQIKSLKEKADFVLDNDSDQDILFPQIEAMILKFNS